MSLNPKVASFLATIATVAVAAVAILGFNPLPDPTYYIRLQEQIMTDLKNVKNQPGQVQTMLTNLLIEFPDITSVMLKNSNQANPVEYYRFINDITLFEAQTNRAKRNVILNDIKNNMNRFIFSGDISHITSLDATN